MNDIKSLDGLLGMSSQVTQIRKSKHHVILLGAPGTGKSTMATLYCEAKNINSIWIHKDNIGQIQPFINNVTIESFFDARQKAIIFDNVESLLQNDKLAISFLTNLLKTTKIKIIITCSEEKKIGDLKRHAELIRLSYPSPETVAAHLAPLLGVPYETVLPVANMCQGSVRETMSQITHGTVNNISSFRNLSPIQCMPLLMSKKLDKVDVEYLIDHDPNIVSCMFYENLPDELHNNRWPKEPLQKFKTYVNILSQYIASTIFEEFMHQHHDWNMWVLVYLIRFCSATDELAKAQSNSVRKTYPYRMSQALSKISHKQIMNKRMISFEQGLSYENKLIFCDIANEECNFVTTYRKYFKK